MGNRCARGWAPPSPGSPRCGSSLTSTSGSSRSLRGGYPPSQPRHPVLPRHPDRPRCSLLSRPPTSSSPSTPPDRPRGAVHRSRAGVPGATALAWAVVGLAALRKRKDPVGGAAGPRRPVPPPATPRLGDPRTNGQVATAQPGVTVASPAPDPWPDGRRGPPDSADRPGDTGGAAHPDPGEGLVAGHPPGVQRVLRRQRRHPRRRDRLRRVPRDLPGADRRDQPLRSRRRPRDRSPSRPRACSRRCPRRPSR